MQRLLAAGLAELKLSLPEKFAQQILRYMELLIQWNQTYNLTAITNPQQVMIKHIFDSLAVLPYLEGQTVIDVGTGAGFPGIPLALADPSRSWCLLDSLGKRTEFLIYVKTQLGLTNLEIVTARVEKYHPTKLFDMAITRAFSSIPSMLQKCRHLSRILYAMKAHLTQEELLSLANYAHEQIPLKIPFLEQHRCLVRIVLS